MIHSSSKVSTRYIYFLKKILLFTPLEVVITVYLQLSEDIAFLYKLEMPLHITCKQTELKCWKRMIQATRGQCTSEKRKKM